ncbi:MAG TPA: DUF3017 domain-containing protein [Nakamurella sp.]|jgi:hypothetical protein|nr:DUF3017 domain-containing protein [Nakamurella sp.]
MVDRRLIRAVPITVVLMIVVLALVLIALAHWRRGAAALGVAMLLAGLLRLILSERTIGVLAVRGKRFDVSFYLISAAFMIGLTIGISSALG